MIIAIPTKNNEVDHHFGHCQHFTIYKTDNKKVLNKTSMASPQGCGCKSNLTELLKQKNVEVLLAGNMGEGAVTKIQDAGIAVIRGCSGNTDSAINNYLAGFLMDSGLICSHHDGDHTCNH